MQNVRLLSGFRTGIFGFLLTHGFALFSGEPAVTFNRDLAPVLFKHCATCHHPTGIGPFSLLTYEDAQSRAKQLAEVTAARVMPPWKPHPDWGRFKHPRRLSDRQLALFQQWVAHGTPEGDPTDLPPAPKFKEGWQLGKPDLILKMDSPFDIPAEGRDIYQHFVFPLNLKTTRYLQGVEVRPGNKRVSHHAVGMLDVSGTARKLAQKQGGQSYNGNGPGFLPAGFTPDYVPGQIPQLFPKGESLTLRPGTDFVLQMHYSASGKAEQDQTQVGLYFSNQPPKRNLGMLLMGSADIDILPGEANYRRTDKFLVPVDYEIRALWAHMHLIGKDVKVWTELPDQKRRNLLWIDDWDFYWQETYALADPVVLPKGTVLHAEFTWDNSADNPHNPNLPPVRVRQGEQSTDEMAGLILTGRPVRAEDEWTAWGAVLAHYLHVESKKPATNR